MKKIWIRTFFRVGLFVLGILTNIHGFEAQQFSLKNGLSVVVIPNHRAPVVVHMMWYKVGSYDDPLGRSGLAHFLEHLMFKGTPRFPEGAIRQIITQNGGEQNASTSYHQTLYYHILPSDRLPIAMQLEADRMSNLSLTSDQVQAERAVVLEECAQSYPENSLAKTYLIERGTLFSHSPYGHPVIGYPHEISSITLEEIMAFYRKFYVPNNALLLLAGDISLDQAKTLVQKYYGSIPPAEGISFPPRVSPPISLPSLSYEILLKSPQTTHLYTRYRYPAPPFAKNLRQSLALVLVCHMLGNNPHGILYKPLIQDHKLLADLSVKYTGDTEGAPSIFISFSHKSIDSERLAYALLLCELRKLKYVGFTQEKLRDSKKQYLYGNRFFLENLGNIAEYVGIQLSLGLTLFQIRSIPQIIQDISLEEVQTAFKENFLQHPLSVTKISPYYKQ